ncbi:MAG: 3-oxoadipate enol-lactonase [Fluviibacter phosphoraccumulans]
MPFLNKSDTRIHYQLNGNPTRPALLFSNSLGTDLSMWDAQVNALSDDFYIIRYDTRGHGHSSRDGNPFGLAALGIDVLELMDHLSLSQVHFCGISMGGLIGQWLAIHASDRLSKLIIANTAAKIGTEEGWISRANTILESGVDPIADSAASRWFTPDFVASHAVDVARLVSMLRQTNPRLYAYCCSAIGGSDLRETVRNIMAHTLVIAGEFDPVTTVNDADYLCEKIAGAQMVTLPASHLSNIEAQNEFNSAIKDFLGAD